MSRSRRPGQDIRILRREVASIRCEQEYSRGFNHGVVVGVVLAILIWLFESVVSEWPEELIDSLGLDWRP